MCLYLIRKYLAVPRQAMPIGRDPCKVSPRRDISGRSGYRPLGADRISGDGAGLFTKPQKPSPTC